MALVKDDSGPLKDTLSEIAPLFAYQFGTCAGEVSAKVVFDKEELAAR